MADVISLAEARTRRQQAVAPERAPDRECAARLIVAPLGGAHAVELSARREENLLCLPVGRDAALALAADPERLAAGFDLDPGRFSALCPVLPESLPLYDDIPGEEEMLYCYLRELAGLHYQLAAAFATFAAAAQDRGLLLVDPRHLSEARLTVEAAGCESIEVSGLTSAHALLWHDYWNFLASGGRMRRWQRRTISKIWHRENRDLRCLAYQETLDRHLGSVLAAMREGRYKAHHPIPIARWARGCAPDRTEHQV